MNELALAISKRWIDFTLHSGRQVQESEIRPFLEKISKTDLQKRLDTHQEIEIKIWSGMRRTQPGTSNLYNKFRVEHGTPDFSLAELRLSVDTIVWHVSRVAHRANFTPGLASDSGIMAVLDYMREDGRKKFEEWRAEFDFFSKGVWTVELSGNIWQIRELPTKVRFDDRNRLHSISSPAIEWRDGFDPAYCIHGVRFFEKEIWERIAKREMTAKEAIGLRNIEQRRVAFQHLGHELILSQLKAQKLDSIVVPHPKREIAYGLYRVNLHDDRLCARFLRVTCPSTGQQALLRVSPRSRNCREAVAWTFGMRPEEYANLEIET